MMKKLAHPTMHSGSRHRDGRPFGRKHNDRQGETNDDYCHVIPALSKDNLYYNIIDDEWYNHGDDTKLSFIEAENQYLRDTLYPAYEKQMERYKKNRQYGRVKEFDDWLSDNLKSGKITIDQQIIQIGNYDDGSVDADTLLDITVDYINESEEWNQAHGIMCVTLDLALHLDERVNGVITPHIHHNRIFLYEDDGIVKCGQEQALRRSDLELPDVTSKVGRHNNLKMTFTKEHREIYLDICERHGVEIDRTAIPDGNVNHLENDEFIFKQTKRKKQQAEKMMEEATVMNEESQQMRLDAQQMLQQAMRLFSAMISKSEEEMKKALEEAKELQEQYEVGTDDAIDATMEELNRMIEELDRKFGPREQSSDEDDYEFT